MRKPDPAPSSTSTSSRLPSSSTPSTNSSTALASDSTGNPSTTPSTSVGATRKRKPAAQDRSDDEDYEPATHVHKTASDSHKATDYPTGGLWAASYQSTQSKLKQNKTKPSTAAPVFTTTPPLLPETEHSSRRRKPLPGSQSLHDKPCYTFADSDDDEGEEEEEDEYIPSTARRKSSSGTGKSAGSGLHGSNSIRDGSDRRHSLAT